MKNRIGLLAFCCAVLSYAGAALADDVGAVGSVAGLQINSPQADLYLQFHGRLYVETSGGLDEYRWGGTSCGAKVLSADEVAALHRALDNKKMQIQPLSQLGQGITKCLVGFTMVPKKYLDAVIP